MSDSARMDAAIRYAVNHDWMLIQLSGARSKAPVLKNWPDLATNDPEVLEKWWTENPDYNIGIKLGEGSGVIDIECDDEDAEKTLLDLCGGEFPVTPTFSASRGKHRLFKWRPDLPYPDNNHFKLGALEFRTGNGGRAAQSVLPPSVHPSGAEYQWVISPDEVDVAEVPDSLMAKIINSLDESPLSINDGNGKGRDKEFWDEIMSGSSEGSRNNDLTSMIGRIVREISDLDNSSYLQTAWMSIQAHNRAFNDPPLPDKEVRAAFKSIVQKDQQRRAAELCEVTFSKQTEDLVREATKDDKDGVTLKELRIVVVKSDPTYFELHSSSFTRNATGYIRLTSKQLKTGSGVAEQCLEQAYTAMDPKIAKQWGTTILPALMASAEHVEAPPEERRLAVVAQAILDCLTGPGSIELGEGGKMNRQNFYRMSDGSYAAVFNQLLDKMCLSTSDKFTRNEVSRMIRFVGASRKVLPNGTFRVISAKGIATLRSIITDADYRVAVDGNEIEYVAENAA